MKSDIVIIGGGAAGLAAACGAAQWAAREGRVVTVTVLERMPRPARKMMITGKGRCNFTNVKPWTEFSAHLRTAPQFLKPAFYHLSPEGVIALLRDQGMESVVERGDRAFPQSHHASDVVDAWVRAARRYGARIMTDCRVTGVERTPVKGHPDRMQFSVGCADGSVFVCSKLIVATGGLSYPATGSTGDGYAWAERFGHSLQPRFPSLTALVPAGYKTTDVKGLIPRETPLSAWGSALCGIHLKNVSLSLEVDSRVADSEFGDVDFTDGGIEGPLGFRLSRDAVKALRGGSRTALLLDLKSGVDPAELSVRVQTLWEEVHRDPRSARLRPRDMLEVLLGKLMPRELVRPFLAGNPAVLPGRKGTAHPNLVLLASVLQAWRLPLEGYVGFERCVVTAGGVSCAEVQAKTLESRLVPGLYFAGEVLDVDADTGGYNLQCAFSTGHLAGESAVRALPIHPD